MTQTKTITIDPAALAKARKRKAEAAVANGRSRLIRNHRFWGVLAMSLTVREAVDGELPPGSPMGVNGVELIYEPTLMDKYTEEELEFIWAHEACHCAQLHMTRIGKRDHMKWNIACDLSVNGTLKDAGFKIPAGALYSDKFKTGDGWLAAETIYDMLPPMPTPQNMAKFGAGSGMGMDKTGVVLQAPNKPGQGKDQGSGPQDINAQWRQNVADAANMARQAGKGLGVPDGMIDQVFGAQVDWREVLAQFVQRSDDEYSWNRPNRRFLHTPGVVLPTLYNETVKDIVLSLDTSGSVGDKELSALLGEIKSILQLFPSTRLKVLFHTDDVYRTEEYTGDEPPPIPLTGLCRGGTDFRPTFKKIEDENITPQCVIMLTDCEGPAPQHPPDYPVLWISVAGDQVPWGEVVKIKV